MRRHLGVGVVLFLALACQSETGGGAHADSDTVASSPATSQDSGRAAVAPSDLDLAALQSAVEKQPEDADARRRLAIALHDAGERDAAIPHFEEALKLDPTPRGRLDLALAYGSKSRLDDAERLYRELIAEQPGHAIALHNLGNLYTKRGQESAAVEWYRKALEVKPDYILAWVHLGDSYRRTERFREAYKAYEKTLTIDPTNMDELSAFDEAIYQMASLDIAMGAPQRAQILLEELLTGNPDHVKANYAYGKLMLQAGRPEDAARAFERHMRILEETEPTGPAATDR